jgi:hypothetical protein
MSYYQTTKNYLSNWFYPNNNRLLEYARAHVTDKEINNQDFYTNLVKLYYGYALQGESQAQAMPDSPVSQSSEETEPGVFLLPGTVSIPLPQPLPNNDPVVQTLLNKRLKECPYILGKSRKNPSQYVITYATLAPSFLLPHSPSKIDKAHHLYLYADEASVLLRRFQPDDADNFNIYSITISLIFTLGLPFLLKKFAKLSYIFYFFLFILCTLGYAIIHIAIEQVQKRAGQQWVHNDLTVRKLMEQGAKLFLILAAALPAFELAPGAPAATFSEIFTVDMLLKRVPVLAGPGLIGILVNKIIAGHLTYASPFGDIKSILNLLIFLIQEFIVFGFITALVQGPLAVMAGYSVMLSYFLDPAVVLFAFQVLGRNLARVGNGLGMKIESRIDNPEAIFYQGAVYKDEDIFYDALDYKIVGPQRVPSSSEV